MANGPPSIIRALSSLCRFIDFSFPLVQCKQKNNDDVHKR